MRRLTTVTFASVILFPAKRWYAVSLQAKPVFDAAWHKKYSITRRQEITMATGIPIDFCDPHSPWQRGGNENTNWLPRQYFQKSTDLSFYGPGILHSVAVELNRRPRTRHGYRTPAEVLTKLLSNPTNQAGVASTT